MTRPFHTRMGCGFAPGSSDPRGRGTAIRVWVSRSARSWKGARRAGSALHGRVTSPGRYGNADSHASGMARCPGSSPTTTPLHRPHLLDGESALDTAGVRGGHGRAPSDGCRRVERGGATPWIGWPTTARSAADRGGVGVRLPRRHVGGVRIRRRAGWSPSGGATSIRRTMPRRFSGRGGWARGASRAGQSFCG
jgi:hypothetical protein